MDEKSRLARAALLLAAWLFAATLARDEPAPTDCPEPREVAAEAGHSTAVACRGAARDLPVRGPARVLVGLPIDPNVADAATLETLPGIGPARALAIVAEREQRRFGCATELTRVPGIGPRTLAGLAGWIGIGEPVGPSGLGPGRPNRVGCTLDGEVPRGEGER